VAIDPAENQENLDKLYRALGHFMVAYSLIGARMVQTLVPLPGPNAAERATVLTKLDAPKLFKEWSSAMEDHSHATDQDREVVRVLVGEARRLSKVRNRLVHSWWAVDDPNGVLMFKMGEPPRGLSPSAEEFENYALQAAVIADAVNRQGCSMSLPAVEKVAGSNWWSGGSPATRWYGSRTKTGGTAPTAEWARRPGTRPVIS